MKRRLFMSQKYMASLIVPTMTFDQKVNALYEELADIKAGRTNLPIAKLFLRMDEIRAGLAHLTGVSSEGNVVSITTT